LSTDDILKRFREKIPLHEVIFNQFKWILGCKWY
jgi:hypothetical protein